MGLVLVVVIFAGARMLKGYTPWQLMRSPFAPSRTQLTTIGKPIANAIEGCRRERGRYPTSLAEAGLDPDPTFYGDWEYVVREAEDGCELSNGDYGRYFFVVWWTPDQGWYIDS